MSRRDYRCDKCQHVWEEDHTIATMDEPFSNPCPECGCLDYGNIVRLISACGYGDPISLGLRKPTTVFQQRMKQIATNHTGKWTKTNSGTMISAVTEV